MSSQIKRWAWETSRKESFRQLLQKIFPEKKKEVWTVRSNPANPNKNLAIFFFLYEPIDYQQGISAQLLSLRNLQEPFELNNQKLCLRYMKSHEK